MSLTGGFFNSKDHDRRYNAESISRLFDGIIEDGVYETYGDKKNKERDAIDPTENRPCLPPQRKSQSRAEAALLPAPGEDP